MKHNTHILSFNSYKQLKAEMGIIGADKTGIELMIPKGELLHIKVQDVPLKAANILKQEMLSTGGEAVLHKGVSMLTKDISDVLLIGTKKQFMKIIKKLKIQPFGLEDIGNEIETVLTAKAEKEQEKILNCRGIPLKIGEKTLIMGILNVTPDSFSDGGKYNNISKAVAHAKKMVEEGADIIDIGGESNRPGHHSVLREEELKRVIPVIEKLSQELRVPISIDTSKADVVKEAILAGANIINDIWGFKKDPDLAKVAAEFDVPVILMHNRLEAKYNSLIDEIIKDLRESIEIATKAGVKPANIILDPGIGFGKTYNDNLIVLNRLEDIVALGFPVLLGTSRKSVIGLTLDAPTDERLEGTIVTNVIGITKGCKIIRVHDVKEIKKAAKMTDTIIRSDFSKE